MALAVVTAEIKSGDLAGAATGTVTGVVISGANTGLLVGVAGSCSTDKTDPVTGVTYNGVALTRAVYESLNNQNGTNLIWLLRTYWYYMAAPDAGTHNVVVSSNAGASFNAKICCIPLTGMDQAAPLSSTAKYGWETGGAFNLGISTPAGGIAFDIVFGQASQISAFTATAGQTVDYSSAPWFGPVRVSHKATATSMGWTPTLAGGTPQESHSIISIAAAGGTAAPEAPTIGTASAGDTTATITFTPNGDGGSQVTGARAISTPGSITGTSTGGSPITVTGLTNGVAYTFTVRQTNAIGNSSESAASNSVTPAAATGAAAIFTGLSGGISEMPAIKVNETVAAQKEILVRLVSDTDAKTAVTGATLSAGDVKVTKPGSTTPANHAGTMTEVGGGLYKYTPSSGEIDTKGFLALKFSKTGWRDVVLTVPIVGYDPYDVLATRRDTGELDRGTAVSATQNSLQAKITSVVVPPGTLVELLDGAIAGEMSSASTFNPTTKAITVDPAWSVDITGTTPSYRLLSGPKMPASAIDLFYEEPAADHATVLTMGAQFNAVSSATNIVTAIMANADMKTMLAIANGDYTFTPPSGLPGTGTLVVKDITGVDTLATYALTFNAAGYITARAST